MKWFYKALIQKFVSILPWSYQINFLFQRFFSVGSELSDTFVIDKIHHARTHISSLNKWGNISIEQAKILEIGTGWYQIVPIVFFLSGGNNIETTDIRMLYNKESINQTIKAFIKLYKNNTITALIPLLYENRIETLKLALIEKQISTKLSLLKMTTTICKCNSYNIDSNSKDLIVSNNTLQFIKKEKLPDFFSELYRIGKPKAVLSLAIDFTDEFSHFDISISNFNFLKFSDFEWRFISNRLNSPNRLRYSDYQNYLSVNFNIVYKEIIQGAEQELDHLKIHKKFSLYNQTDILVKHGYLVCLTDK